MSDNPIARINGRLAALETIIAATIQGSIPQSQFIRVVLKTYDENIGSVPGQDDFTKGYDQTFRSIRKTIRTLEEKNITPER